MIQPPFCNEALDECGWPLAAPFFWVSFQILSAFLFLNVVVAVVLQIFEVRNSIYFLMHAIMFECEHF
jgi:hypothetical protein